MSVDATPTPSKNGRTAWTSARHVRHVTVATVLVAAAIVLIAWLVSVLVLRDLSRSYVSGVITQAQEQAEVAARLQTTFGEGEAADAIAAGRNRPMDPDLLLTPRLPDVFDEDGRRLPVQVPDGGRLLRRETGPEGQPLRVPALLETSGREWRSFVNGELVQRDAVQYVKVSYPGGHRFIQLRTVDQRDFDQSVLNDPDTHAMKELTIYRPSSRQVTIRWDADFDGEVVQLQAGLDPTVIDEGIAELRRQVVPKIVISAGAFLVVLVLAYAWVLFLMARNQRLEAEASEQALLAQLGMLAAGLAHEIRNPLSAVHMNLQLLEEDLDEEAHSAGVAPAAREQHEEHVSLLRSTQREIRRLGSLVSDFLACARPPEPRSEPHRLDDVVEDCVDLFRSVAAGAGVELVEDLQAGDETTLLDDALVKQAVTNVLLNAIQAAPDDGGKVWVTTRKVRGGFELSVRDNGEGLPEDPESLFRVFHSTKKTGSGLGLPISRAIVDRHGGTLDASTADGGGAVFTIRLPVREAA